MFDPRGHWPPVAVRPLLVVPGATAARIAGYGCIRGGNGDLFHSDGDVSDEASRVATEAAAEETVTLFRPAGPSWT